MKSPRNKHDSQGSNGISGEFRQSRNAQPRGLKWLKEQFRPSKRSTSAPNLGSSRNQK